MPSITYSYVVNQSVWTIDATYGVRCGIVKTVTYNANVANVDPDVEYQIQYTDSMHGSQTLKEEFIFGDIDTALASYKDLITC